MACCYLHNICICEQLFKATPADVDKVVHLRLILCFKSLLTQYSLQPEIVGNHDCQCSGIQLLHCKTQGMHLNPIEPRNDGLLVWTYGMLPPSDLMTSCSGFPS